jgi:hypothetical protein
MADLITIAEAKIYSLSLQKITGIQPDMEIKTNGIRIYYTPDKLIKVQKILEMKMNEKSKITIDFLPMFLPILIKKSIVPLMAILGTGFLIGKKT